MAKKRVGSTHCCLLPQCFFYFSVAAPEDLIAQQQFKRREGTFVGAGNGVGILLFA